ncbi:MAG: DUF3467 domain-containing protein [Proteobacteria bacterium]|nr:DUF3467 domain-containing protein [Pseudomonadota bacterium]
MTEEKKTSVIHVDPAVENGRYANAATIMHSFSEFIMDFLMLLPGDRKKVVSRIIVSPGQAKQIARALLDNIEKYEDAYGKISLPAGKGDFSGPVN